MRQRGWHRWTKAEHRLLVQKYMRCGDGDIARMLNERFPKGYPWTNKHVEKRRKYFKLSRGRKSGQCFSRDMKKHWDTRGRAKQGEVRHWQHGGRRKPFIKINDGFVDYARWKAKAKPGQVVRSIEGPIRILTRAEHAILNKQGRLPIEIQETILTLNKLKNLINGKENRRPTRNAV